MELEGMKEADVFVKELSNEEAIIEMVDSNMYRDKILPSEKAFAYKMKLDAMKHQGKSLSPKGTKSHSVDNIEDTKTQIYRYVRLTYLIPELLQLVDDTVLKDKRTSLTMGLSKEKKLDFDSLEELLNQIKGNQNEQISFNKSKIEKALPSELLKRDKRYIEEYIIKALENYKSFDIKGVMTMI